MAGYFFIAHWHPGIFGCTFLALGIHKYTMAVSEHTSTMT